MLLDTFYRPAMLRRSVGALLAQTYGDIEVILIDNGATAESKTVIAELAAADARVRVLAYERNHFSWDDPHLMVKVCYNDALAMASGDLIFHQADDDWVAADFFERIVPLFTDNPDCTTALGMPVPVRDGRPAPWDPAVNRRPRYMPGHDLAMAHLNRRRDVYSNPGFSFVMRKDALVEAGGFDATYEMHMMYAVAAFGVSGFDPDANMFWQYHEGQLNKALTDHGWVDIDYTRSFLDRFGLERRWGAAHGADEARRVAGTLMERSLVDAAEVFAANISRYRFRAAARTLRLAWRHPGFWRLVPIRVIRKWRWFAASLLRLVRPRREAQGGPS